MKYTRIISALTLISLAVSSASAQATWIGGAGDNDNSNAANWSPAVAPASGTAFAVGNADPLGLSANYTAPSVTINSGINANILALGGPESLTIGSGGLIMNGASFQMDAILISSASSTWQINSGSVTFTNFFDIQTGLITINLASGTSINFAVAPVWAGTGINFTGAGVTASSISAPNFGPAQIAKVTINGAAAQLSGGKIVPTVIPEPSTFATLAGVMVLGFVALRRRKTVAVAA